MTSMEHDPLLVIEFEFGIRLLPVGDTFYSNAMSPIVRTLFVGEPFFQLDLSAIEIQKRSQLGRSRASNEKLKGGIGADETLSASLNIGHSCGGTCVVQKEGKVVASFPSMNSGYKKCVFSDTWLTAMIFMWTLVAKPLASLTQELKSTYGAIRDMIILRIGRQFYYRCFIGEFSKVVNLVSLTQKIGRMSGKEQEGLFRYHRSETTSFTTHDLELGAVVFALKTWRHYLYGMKSIIYTDRKSPQHIFDQKELNMRQRSGLNYLVTMSPSVKDKILAALGKVSKVENVTVEMLRGMDQLIERKEGGAYKTYHDLRDMYGGHVWRRILYIYLAKLRIDLFKVNADTSKNLRGLL
ncbi:putative reverse transcriptase domain-containing protein [Tanacetum coccineum]